MVRERTDPRTLPGLEAMMPGSALTRLLHHPDLTTAADLTVIAGDIEGQGSTSPWHKLKVLFSDWFYGAEHDLVVNTGSMSGGLARRPGRPGRARTRGRRWTISAISRTSAACAGSSLASPGATAKTAASSHSPPSLLGPALARGRGTEHDDDDPRPGRGPARHHGQPARRQRRTGLARLQRPPAGGLKKIRMGIDATPTGLVDEFYAPWSSSWRAVTGWKFSYDWRLSVRAAAARLAEKLADLVSQAERDKQPVHLVAHPWAVWSSAP